MKSRLLCITGSRDPQIYTLEGDCDTDSVGDIATQGYLEMAHGTDRPTLVGRLVTLTALK